MSLTKLAEKQLGTESLGIIADLHDLCLMSASLAGRTPARAMGLQWKS